MTNTFSELGLSARLLQAVAALQYENPTDVQAQAIPAVLEGKDVVASAKTGTGKTAAFSLPLLDRYAPQKGNQGPSVLIVTPTRELAQQIATVCTTIAEKTHHRILAVVGGVALEPQIKALNRGIDVLIATPGRLLDLMDQQALHLDHVQALVLDEADRMLDMGFWPSVRRIIAATPAKRQTLLFSATIDESIEKTVGRSLKDPVMVTVASCGDVAETIEQYILRTPQEVKPELLRALLTERGSERVIVFARTRSRADSCVHRLKRAGFRAEAIHSDRSQNQRQRALENFSSGKTGILVATDVLARGIDVSEVAYVINYDLPMQAEDYVHRVGRTGRAGQEGFSVSFVTPDGEEMLRKIEKLTHERIPEMTLEHFDMEEAKNRAAERTQRRVAAQDPDIQAAKREMAQREKEKKANREKAKAAHGKTTRGSSRGKMEGAPQAHKHNRTAQGQTAKRPGGSTANRSTAAKRSTSTGSGWGDGASRKNSSRPKAYAAASATKSDLRPGCSRRAAIAQQRSKTRRS